MYHGVGLRPKKQVPYVRVYQGKCSNPTTTCALMYGINIECRLNTKYDIFSKFLNTAAITDIAFRKIATTITWSKKPYCK